MENAMSGAPTPQPIVLVGGILTFPTIYGDMRASLERITGQPVWVVQIFGHEWIPTLLPAAWARLLDRVDRAVHQAVRASPTGKATLVGHSAGGLLSRMYLGPKPFRGRAYRGLDYVDHLITLGSPHYIQHHSLHYGWIPGWLEKHYPDAYFPQVRYKSIAGKLIYGTRHGTWREHFAYGLYLGLIGYGKAWGDGLVPITSALLRGSSQVILDGVSHYAGFGGPWYGEEDIIPLWWNA